MLILDNIEGSFSFVSLLKACGKKKDIQKGIKLHGEIVKKGLLGKCPYVATTLISMYAKCGEFSKAHQVFEELPTRTTYSWNALLSLYAQQGQGHEALQCLEAMQRDGFTPDSVSFTCILKACGKIKSLRHKCKQIHDEIVCSGLLREDVILGTGLVDMYVQCGELDKAKEMIQELPIQNVVSWNALIAGYAKNGQGFEALSCFERMQSEAISPDVVTFISVLKACSSGGVMDERVGKRINRSVDEAIDKGVAGKGIDKALVEKVMDKGIDKIIDKIVIDNSAIHNGIDKGINKYVDKGIGNGLYKSIDMGIDKCTVKIIDKCAIDKDTSKGINIGAINNLHVKIVNSGTMEKDIVVGTALAGMYAKCGELLRAYQVLEGLPVRNVVSWSALLSGYVQHGQPHEAFNCFEQMLFEGIPPDAVTYICILKACGIVKDIDKGKKIHDEIMRKGMLATDIVLGNALVDMYAKFGMLTQSRQVFENLHVRDVISWSTLIAAYVQEGQGDEALNCFLRMQRDGFSPNDVTFILVLKACGSIKAIDQGIQIHDEIVRRGLLERSIVLGNTLVDMYAKCGLLTKAHEVLLELPVRDIVSWNALISGYVQHRRDHEALESFEKMQSDGLSPDEVTFTCILKSCGSTGAIDKGKQIHEKIVGKGLLEKDTGLGNALVDMYAKCGMLSKAHELLEELPVRSVVSWCALISGHVQQGHYNVALNCFEQMQREGFSLDPITCICILNACANTGDIDKGKQIHDDIVTRGLMENDIVIGTALVDMYAKCGAPTDAEKILQGLPIRDIVCWNALICAYAQQGRCQEALNCFECMRNEFIDPDAVTFISILNACASMGAINKGKQIHEEIVNRSLLKDDIMLGNALVDMYAKCGELAKARNMLDELPSRDVITWNALIAGYSQKGRGREALDCIECMQSEGLFPDEVTCLCVLSACSHRGLLDEAQTVFANMTKKYGIAPMLEHHTCMLLVLGCAGHFDEAVSVIKVMPSSDYPAVWLTLLSGCRKWGNVKLGGLAFDQVVQLDSSYAAAYILMADIFRAAGMQKDAENVEMMRLKYGLTANGITHIFDGS